MLWHTEALAGSYSLKFDWKLMADHNGGAFGAFPNRGNDPFVAVNGGYEIQIDATDAPNRTTGATHTFQGADADVGSASLKPLGSWNSCETIVEGETTTVVLNRTVMNEFTSIDCAQ